MTALRIKSKNYVSHNHLLMLMAGTMVITSFDPSNASNVIDKAIEAVSPPNVNGDVIESALSFTFGKEGGCQNWANDKGNWFQGRRGWTCMGIVPATWHRHRNGLAKGLPADVKQAHDQDPVRFKQVAAEIYKKDYFIPGGCHKLAHPASTICFDIAVNSGPGTSKRFLKAATGTPLQQAESLINQHHQFYQTIVARDPSQAEFINGWNNRTQARRQYVQTQQP